VLQSLQTILLGGARGTVLLNVKSKSRLAAGNDLWNSVVSYFFVVLSPPGNPFRLFTLIVSLDLLILMLDEVTVKEITVRPLFIAPLILGCFQGSRVQSYFYATLNAAFYTLSFHIDLGIPLFITTSLLNFFYVLVRFTFIAEFSVFSISHVRQIKCKIAELEDILWAQQQTIADLMKKESCD
jgi:hypothetical protein